MADALFEFEAYADPEQNFSAAYNPIHSEYLGVDMHDAAVWAFNPMYGSDPIYLQSFVVGEMVAHQIQDKIDEKFGRNLGEKEGEYLQLSFYSHGASQSMDKLMRGGTGKPLSPRSLIRFLQNSPPLDVGALEETRKQFLLTPLPPVSPR